MLKIILFALLLIQFYSNCAAVKEEEHNEFICIEKEQTMLFLENKFDNIERKLQQVENIKNLCDMWNLIDGKLEDLKAVEKKRKFESAEMMKYMEIIMKKLEKLENPKRIEDQINEIENNNNELEGRALSNENIQNLQMKFIEIKDSLDGIQIKCSHLAKAPTSCVAATELTQRSGIYNIQVSKFSKEPFAVACDVNHEGHGWLVIQRRQDGSVDFYRNWDEYKRGFGNLNGEFWIGLDKLHAITNSSQHELLIFMEDYENKKLYAKYDAFAIGDESEKYTLTVLGDYTGNATDSLKYHKGMKFTTKDMKNDSASHTSCAVTYKGAWWYNKCYFSNLNGMYFTKEHAMTKGEGICWHLYREDYSMKFVQMMIRPKRM